MENTELIKNFERIRDYMRQFYVYGFKSRSEMNLKSPRSYDNERRRIESWLGEYMSFRREGTGKQVFLSLDSRAIEHNPLYSAFKAKSFTGKDITFHFYILDALADDTPKTVAQLLDHMELEYLSCFPDADVLDISTLRKKLREYEKLGLVQSKKQGKELLYSLPEEKTDLTQWRDALDFFGEASPLGVIGSYLLDRLPEHESPFRFKHHYLLHTLDSQILAQLLDTIVQEKWATVVTLGKTDRQKQFLTVLPCKIYISAQTGRQYVLCYHPYYKSFRFLRLDMIHGVTPGNTEKDYSAYLQKAEGFCQKLWGVSTSRDDQTDHIEMIITAADDEPHILQRLLREKRNGTVEILDRNTYRFQADVYSAMEMLPWLRTFLGRIVSLQCSDPSVTQRFYEDLDAMYALYGGEG